MAKKQPSVFVIAEQNGKGIQPVSLQLVGKARQLAESLDSGVGVIVLGYNLEDIGQTLIEAGADSVLQGDSSILIPYQSELYTDVIVRIAAKYRPEILLLGSTSMGRELAPLLAARLETGLTAHCIDLSIDPEGILEQHIPAYGGMITIVCPERRPQIATVANGVFSNPELDPTRTGEILPVEIPDDFPLRAKTLEIVREESEGVSLDAASVIVVGGAGAGDFDGWSQIAGLAKVLNAGFGSTRPAVDSGWTELETMIGQSGKIVNPKLYIGVGISGELQHMVGIVGAKVMIAINNDPKAPVFKQVDYGVVEDCRVFVPALVKALTEKELSKERATHAI